MLNETDDDNYIFTYNDLFLLDKSNSAVSLSFSKSQKDFYAGELFPFFYNMLSEGANKMIQCRNLKIDENDAFGLLLATAHTDTIGAIAVRKI